MHLLIISGFLGSGKTSILMPFARQLTAKGKRIAIIENEIGENGVDDLFLQENGLYVKQIYHGCICCGLRADLVSALFELERTYKPDVILLEPTGIADPHLILASVSGYSGNLESKTMVTIVDAERFEEITNLKIPLVIDGIENADVVALNKIDLVAPEDLEQLSQRIMSIRPDAEIQKVSAHDEKLLANLFQRIESKAFSTQIYEERKRRILEKKGTPPTVCSRSFTFSEDEICLSELETKRYYRDNVYRVAILLKAAGADLIGNLKLIIKSDRNGYLLVSTTSFSRHPEVTGKMPGGYSTITFTINAMAYGIEQESLNTIISQVFPYERVDRSINPT